MTRAVSYSPHARQQLADLYLWIAEESELPNRAENYTSAILDFCESLAEFPFIGIARDDLRLGVRTIGFRHRVMIAFEVTDSTVAILGIYYGGRDFETLLLADE